MSARSVEERLAYMAANPPGKAGQCAHAVWLALGVPALGAPDAAAAAHHVQAAGHMKPGPAPRGAVMYWVGGHSGHGHMALSLGNQQVRSTDVNHPGGVGDVPFAWFSQHWPQEHYLGWSSWYGVDLPMDAGG